MNKSEYYEYLASRDWAILKEQVKARSKGFCERCDAGEHEATHHLTYQRIGCERLQDLQGVCLACHQYLSGKTDVDPIEVNVQGSLSTVDTDIEDLLDSICDAHSSLFIYERIYAAKKKGWNIEKEQRRLQELSNLLEDFRKRWEYR